MHSSILLGSIEKSNRGILSAIRKLNKSDSDKKGDNLEKQREEKSYNERLLKAISGVEQNTKGKGSTSGGKKGGLGIGAGAGLGLAALKGAGVVTGLAALGFGIGGFFSGLALAGSVSDMLGVNMNAVKSQMVTLGEAFSETPTDGLLKMGALLAAGGAFGALFGAKTSGKAAAGMTAIGLGIGGFFANGGVTKPNKSYIVGERGPELFTPGVTGRVTPNHEMGGGSTTVVVNVDASGSSVQGDEEEGRALGVALSVAIETELIKQKRPGGLLA